MPAGGGLAAGLAAAFDAAQGQADRQNKLKMQQLKMQQEALQFQYLQQQAIIGQKSDQFAALQAAGVFDQQPQPPPSPQDVSQMGPRPQPQQQGGPPPQMGGLPGSQPMPGAQPPQQGGQQMNALLGNIPAGQPAPLLNGRMAGGGAPPPQQGQPQPQQGGGGFGGLQPPPTLQSVAQQVAQQAIKNGLSPQDPSFGPIVMSAARKNFPAMQEAWKNQLEVVKAQQAAQDREQFHQDHEQDVAAQRGLTAAIAGERTQRQGWGIFQKQDGTLLRVNKDTGDVKAIDNADAKDLSKPGAGAAAPRSVAMAVFNKWHQQNPNASAEDMQRFIAENKGIMAGEQSLGTRSAQLDLLGREVEKIAPNVLADSKAVSRTQYPTINKLIEAAQEGTGGTKIVALGTDLTSLIDIYARYLNPSGAATDASRGQAQKILNEAWADGQIDTAVNRMTANINLGRQAAKEARADLRAGVGGGAAPGDMQSSAAAPAQSGGWSFEPVK